MDYSAKTLAEEACVSYTALRLPEYSQDSARPGRTLHSLDQMT